MFKRKGGGLFEQCKKELQNSYIGAECCWNHSAPVKLPLFGSFLTKTFKEGVKKRIFYGQALGPDRKQM